MGQDHDRALSRHARRLLRAMASDQNYAVADPTNEDEVIVRASRGGVSVGNGSFPVAALEALLSHDLVRLEFLGGKRIYRLSRAGEAHLRRAEAQPDLAFLAQHQELVEGLVEVEGKRTSVAMDAAESPLDWLRRRKNPAGEPYIDAPSYEAGERLRRDLTFAAMLPRVTANWSASIADKGRGAVHDPAGASDAAVAARQRVTRALDAVGSDLADLLIDLCGFLKGLERIERERRWPARSGKIMAKLALGRLADHYGLRRVARGAARSRGITVWLSDAPADAGPG